MAGTLQTVPKNSLEGLQSNRPEGNRDVRSHFRMVTELVPKKSRAESVLQPINPKEHSKSNRSHRAEEEHLAEDLTNTTIWT